jgi:hypothetical protein
MNNPAPGAPSRRRVVIATVIAVLALTGVVLLSVIIWPAGCGTAAAPTQRRHRHAANTAS